MWTYVEPLWKYQDLLRALCDNNMIVIRISKCLLKSTDTNIFHHKPARPASQWNRVVLMRCIRLHEDAKRCTVIRRFVKCICVVFLTTHLLSIERADWPKPHDMFKARDAKAWQREFPVGSPVCGSNLLLINIFLDIVARIESRCVIKAKHVLLVC